MAGGPFSDLRTRLPLFVVGAAGLAFALIAGASIGSESLLIVIGAAAAVVAIFFVLSARGRFWFLIPACWSLTGGPPFLPISFTVRDLSVLFSFGVFLVLMMLRAVRTRSRFSFLDWLVLANLGYLASVYVRNPVGTAAFGSSMVGGRPYFDAVIAALAYIVLRQVPLGPGPARILPLLMAIPQIAISLLGTLAQFVPRAGDLLSKFYSGFSASTDPSEMTDDYVPGGEIEGSRWFAIAPGAKVGGLLLFGYYRAESLLNPLRAGRCALFLTTLGAMALSGFRSGIAFLGISFVLAAFLRRGFGMALRIILVLALAIAVLIGLQSSGVHLPDTVQRALSFLPGNWDRDAKGAAKESSEWRYYMWQQALGTNEFIKNKLLGDGFGFTSMEYQIMTQSKDVSSAFVGSSDQESFMIVGAFHSGPISAIRFVGLVGFILYILLLVASAVIAWRLVRKSLSTPYLPLAIFLGLPIIYEPINYLFVFGGFDSGFPNTIFACAMLRLLSQNLARWKEQNRAALATVERPELEPSPLSS